MAQYPHCNQDVLHAPGECYYCDLHPELQRVRAAGKTPFTPNESNGWSGNVAAPAGKMHTHMGTSFVPGEEPEIVEVDRPYIQCDSPPFGFFCLGGKGHDGPCAAWCHWWFKPYMKLKTGHWWP